MTEQQIQDGFRQLEGALAPPADTLERVDRRVRTRRRRRRTAVVGAVAVVAAGCLGTAVALSGGDDGGDLVATDPPSGSTLVLTRADGSTYAFSDVTVTCEKPAYEESGGHERIYAYNDRDITNKRLNAPWLYFSAIVDEVQGDQTIELPVDWSMASADQPMILFVADSVGDPGGNEVSTDEEGAAGTVRVLEASCDPVPVLRLAVDTDLGSEVGMGTLHVSGGLD